MANARDEQIYREVIMQVSGNAHDEQIYRESILNTPASHVRDEQIYREVTEWIPPHVDIQQMFREVVLRPLPLSIQQIYREVIEWMHPHVDVQQMFREVVLRPLPLSIQQIYREVVLRVLPVSIQVIRNNGGSMECFLRYNETVLDVLHFLRNTSAASWLSLFPVGRIVYLTETPTYHIVADSRGFSQAGVSNRCEDGGRSGEPPQFSDFRSLIGKTVPLSWK